MRSLIIIPAYNEASQISAVVAGIKAMAGDCGDILVVDDGSSDETSALARESGATVIRHAVNRGQGAALKTGIDFAVRSGYEAAVFFDADGQMKPEEIGTLLAKLAEGFDVALGSRNLGRAIRMPLLKRWVKKLALVFTKLSTGLKLTDTHIGFQAWRVPALARLRLDQDRMAHASQILMEISRLRLKYAEVPVTISYTDYSIKKGQKLSGAIRILWDLLIK